HEADIVAQAGLPGQITVATQMAGRGTDIKLAPVVEEAGGLHVILTEYHDASRIDRQLAGRCARQGDPGSFEVLVSGEDSLLEGKTFMGMRKLVLSVTFTPFSERLGLARLKWTQKQVERRHASIRRQLFQSDEKQDERLSFTGSG
ncbi:protein translocase subunit SecA, partial [Elysia marginata]